MATKTAGGGDLQGYSWPGDISSWCAGGLNWLDICRAPAAGRLRLLSIMTAVEDALPCGSLMMRGHCLIAASPARPEGSHLRAAMPSGYSII